MKNKLKLALCVILASAAMWAAKSAASYNRASIKWARNLQAKNVAKIEMTVFPSEEGKYYKAFDKEDTKWIVDIINSAEGKYVPRPHEIAGGMKTLYVVMKDGTVHKVSNNGNVYIVIDGDSYKASYKYLNGMWEELGTGESEIPRIIPYIDW
jgi:hypothetical protein